jgi:protein-disulfide isomerase
MINMSSKLSISLSVAAVAVSIATFGFTAYKVNPDNMYKSITKSLEDKQKSEMEKMQKESEKYIKDNYASITDVKTIAANPNGTINVVLFSDYQCGYCRKIHNTLSEVVKNNTNVKLIVKEFPILGQDSLEASIIGLMIAEKSQEKYATFHTKMFEGKVDAKKYAMSIGFTAKEVETALSSEEYKKKIMENHSLGQKIGIRGTPALIIGEKFFPGLIDENTINSEIKKQSKK